MYWRTNKKWKVWKLDNKRLVKNSSEYYVDRNAISDCCETHNDSLSLFGSLFSCYCFKPSLGHELPRIRSARSSEFPSRHLRDRHGCHKVVWIQAKKDLKCEQQELLKVELPKAFFKTKTRTMLHMKNFKPGISHSCSLTNNCQHDMVITVLEAILPTC